MAPRRGTTSRSRSFRAIVIGNMLGATIFSSLIMDTRRTATAWVWIHSTVSWMPYCQNKDEGSHARSIGSKRRRAPLPGRPGERGSHVDIRWPDSRQFAFPSDTPCNVLNHADLLAVLTLGTRGRVHAQTAVPGCPAPRARSAPLRGYAPRAKPSMGNHRNTLGACSPSLSRGCSKKGF